MIRRGCIPKHNGDLVVAKECDIYKTKCVVCGNVKHRGAYEKHRISETERAKKFLKATIFMQDEVFTRTCDLQDAQSVFGADLYCHKLCIRDYLIKYDRACKDKSSTKSDCKQKAWLDVAEQLETRLSKGEGFELSYIRDCVNEKNCIR